jgi:hypothetical protein
MWNQLVKEAADFCGEQVKISETSAIELPEPFAGLRAELSKFQDNRQDKSFRAHVVAVRSLILEGREELMPD